MIDMHQLINDNLYHHQNLNIGIIVDVISSVNSPIISLSNSCYINLLSRRISALCVIIEEDVVEFVWILTVGMVDIVVRGENIVLFLHNHLYQLLLQHVH